MDENNLGVDSKDITLYTKYIFISELIEFLEVTKRNIYPQKSQ